MNKSDSNPSLYDTTNYSLPLADTSGKGYIVTSDFGKRRQPCPGASTMHQGIDIACNNEPLLATEDGGRVVKVCHNTSAASGKYVTVEYPRPDGSKLHVRYMHMSKIDVKEGDMVSAGQKIGVSGNTGRSTGAHLHFDTAVVTASGEKRYVDPREYLAELEVRGNLSTRFTRKGSTADYLAQPKESVAQKIASEPNAPLLASHTNKLQEDQPSNRQQTQGDWFKSLLSTFGGGKNDMCEALLTMFMLMSMRNSELGLDYRTQTEGRELAQTRTANISELNPEFDTTHLTADHNGRITISSTLNGQTYSHRMTPDEQRSVNGVMTDSSLSPADKSVVFTNYVGRAMNTEVIARSVSNDFDQALNSANVRSYGLSL